MAIIGVVKTDRVIYGRGMIADDQFRSGGRIEALETRIAPASLLVTNFADSGDGSLRDAINKANASVGADSITFTGGGTIKLLSTLPAITDDLVISAAKTVTLQGQGKVELLQITGTGINVTFHGLKLTGGVAKQGGALLINDPNGKILIENSVITGNKAIGTDGGAASGGAIANLAGSLTLDSSDISGNQAWSASTATQYDAGTKVRGGAIYNLDSLIISLQGDQSKPTTISKNTACGDVAKGGAIYNGDGARMVLNHAILSGNSAQGINGANGANGVKGANGSPGAYAGYDGSDGMAGGDGGDGGYGGYGRGGAIDNHGTLTITSSKISGNIAAGGKGGDGGNGGTGGNGGKGGPAFTSYGYAYPAGRTGIGGDGGHGGKSGHGGGGFGGGIANSDAGSVTISGSEISGNTAKNGIEGKSGKGGAGGKGRYSGYTGAVWVNSFQGNSAYGGGLMNEGYLSIDSSTVSKNQISGGAVAIGGGIANHGTLMVSKTTISSNTVKSASGANGVSEFKAFYGDKGKDGWDGTDGGFAAGGGIYNDAQATVANSVISGNAVQSGNGGNGGNGGAGGNADPRVSYYGGSGGNGGNAGKAGDAGGGGIFTGDGSYLTVSDSNISSNKVTAGHNGKAGKAGKAGAGPKDWVGSGVDGQNGAPAALGHGDGGGISCIGGNLDLSQSMITNNSVNVLGGGVAVENSVASSISGSTITGNHAKYGGGLYVGPDSNNDPVKVISTVISKNYAKQNNDVLGPIDQSIISISRISALNVTMPMMGAVLQTAPPPVMSDLSGALTLSESITQTAFTAIEVPANLVLSNVSASCVIYNYNNAIATQNDIVAVNY